MEEPRSMPVPSPHPSREAIGSSWGLDLTPERAVAPRKSLRQACKAPHHVSTQPEGKILFNMI